MRLKVLYFFNFISVIGLLLSDLGCGSSKSDSSSTEPKAHTNRPTPQEVGNAVEGDVIYIGIIASESGELRPWGIDSVIGAKLAVEEANAAGGVKGKKIELLIGDSASKPEIGKSAAEMLINQRKVVGLMGEVSSGITAQIAQTAFKEGVPLISIAATRKDITQIGSNIFRVCYTDDLQGAMMAKFAYDELGLESIAIITDRKQPYSTGLSNSFRYAFERLGGKIIDEQFYESGQTQFSSQLTNIKPKNPDGIFMSGYFTEVGPLVRQSAQAGLRGVKLGGDGWDNAEILTSGGKAILGSFFCNHYNNDEERPELKNFLKKWIEKQKDAPGTTMGALAYDATALMIDALKRSKELNSKDLTEALENTVDFKGVTGSMTLKGMKGNPPKRLLVVEVTSKGQVPRKSYEYAEIKDSLMDQNL